MYQEGGRAAKSRDTGGKTLGRWLPQIRMLFCLNLGIRIQSCLNSEEMKHWYKITWHNFNSVFLVFRKCDCKGLFTVQCSLFSVQGRYWKVLKPQPRSLLGPFWPSIVWKGIWENYIVSTQLTWGPNNVLLLAGVWTHRRTHIIRVWNALLDVVLWVCVSGDVGMGAVQRHPETTFCKRSHLAEISYLFCANISRRHG